MLPFVSDSICVRSLSIEADAGRHLSPEFLQLHGRTNITFDVRACSDAHVILYVIDFDSEPPGADVIDIVLGAENNTESAIRNCEGSVCSYLIRIQHSPLHCGEFRRFVVGWEEGIEVRTIVDGTWRTFLTYSPGWDLFQVRSIFFAYKYNTVDSTASDWKIGEYSGCRKHVHTRTLTDRKNRRTDRHTDTDTFTH